MTNKLRLTIMLCLIVQSFHMPGESCGQEATRNLAAYDKAGPYSIDNEPPWEKRERILEEIRGFLWEHWKERRLGVVSASFFSIEGDSTSSKFFVEPDAKSCWRIAVESESTLSAMLPKGRPRRESTYEEYDLIDRIEISTESLAPIPEQASRQPKTYRLRLRNSRKNSQRII